MRNITEHLIKIIILPMILLLTSPVLLRGQSSDSWKFIIYGDTRSNDSAHRSVLRSITENTPDYRFIINVGDVVADGTSTRDWETWQNACNDILGGTGQDNVPPKYMAVTGNHDDLGNSDGKNNWRQYLYGQTEQFGNGGEFFVLDYENARFILLNSDTNINNEQLDMLHQAISNNTKTWLFAVWHHPIFPFGAKSYENSIHNSWGVPLYNGGADIIFTGHAHYYVRSEKLRLNGQEHPPLDTERGTVHIVTGNGGAPLYSLDPGSNEYMVAGSYNDYGYTELTVEGNILNLRHITDDGNVVDEETYTANPKAGTADDYIISASGENPPDETKENAFDGDINTKWLAFDDAAWIQVDYADAGRSSSVVNEYRLTSAADSPERDPRDWRLLGSNDGSTWIELDSRSGETFFSLDGAHNPEPCTECHTFPSSRNKQKIYSFNNITPYSVYRLDITSNYDPPSANSTQIAEIEFVENSASTSSLTLSKTNYDVNETIVVNYSGLPGNSTDWVGIYEAGTNDQSYLQFTYSNGSINGTMEFNGLPTPGNYEARLFFNDSYNLENFASFMVVENGTNQDSGDVSNNQPLVTITEPDGGSTFMPGESITFAASAADPEEGDLCADIEWTSDHDGIIGSGCTFNTSSLSENTHFITASVTDSAGASNSDQITIMVGEQVTLGNLVLPASGGLLESFTSEYGSGWAASDLINGITNEDGWSSEVNPGSQEFIFSFQGGLTATLNEAVIHGGTGEGTYFSKDVEVWTSADGNNYTKAASGTLQNTANNSITFDLAETAAKKIKLVVTSGYRDDYWELGEFEVYGAFGVTPVEDFDNLPAVFNLAQNYPNPFNPSTTIEYSIASNKMSPPGKGFGSGLVNVQLKVYDFLGREVATLVDKEHMPGIYKIHFDGSGLPSGIYIIQMTAGKYRGSLKMQLIK